MAELKLPITERQESIIRAAHEDVDHATNKASLVLSTVLAGHDYPDGCSYKGVFDGYIILEKPPTKKKNK